LLQKTPYTQQQPVDGVLESVCWLADEAVCCLVVAFSATSSAYEAVLGGVSCDFFSIPPLYKA